MSLDKQMRKAVKVADGLDDVTPQEWDVLNQTWRSSTRYGHLAHPADPVSKPVHYISDGVEAIDYIKQQVEDPCSYLEGNVLKYMHRYKRKGKPVEDLRKARQYLDWLIREVCVEGIE